ncbi:MAG: photosynthetic complex putative assembly protein PuhB [Rhodoblastus sp.]
MSEFERDVAPGLPEALPEGERVLMQTRPAWRSLAIHAFHARKIAIYCAAILAWRVGAGLAAGKGFGASLLDGATVAPLAILGVLLPVALAWAYARTTIYTITDRRVVLRTGVALPMTFNLPYKQIDTAALRVFADGTGDIPLKLTGGTRLAFAHLWPSVRAWRVNNPEPMLRALPDAEAVAQTLGRALAAVHGVTPTVQEAAPAPQKKTQLETAAA